MRNTMVLGALAVAAPIALAGPQYTITDLGVIAPGDAVQGTGVSDGGVAFGRTLGSNQAFYWTEGTGMVALDNEASHPYGVANGANDSGLVVGIGTTTSFGSGAVPLMWQNGVVSQLDMVPGSGVGRAYAVNASGMIVGSNGGGVDERAVYWTGGTLNQITATTTNGTYMTTAYGVTDTGLVVGQGINPNALANNVALVYDTNTGVLTEIPSLAGDNGGIAFGASANGYVVGSSSYNQSNGLPVIWSETEGTVEIGLPTGASMGSARDANSSGWAVGTASGLYALPFLYDGADTYLLQDLIGDNTGWDISTNTFSSALGIAEDGSIVGTGLVNGEIRAYKMTLVPTPAGVGLFGIAGVAAARRRRR